MPILITPAHEGVALRRMYEVGVQWHPEEMVSGDPAMRLLFEACVTACRALRPSR